jgi:AcrR family transcriptional regulator
MSAQEKLDKSPVAELRRSLALLWGVVAEPTRGPKPGLTVERIVTAAIELADAEGLSALSMRNLAAALGVGTMTLYRYVPGRGELVALMVERVQAPGPVSPGPTWRERVEHNARGQWELFRRHPWVLQISQGRPMLGPQAMAGTEIALRDFDGTGMPPLERISTVVLVSSFVAGLARSGVEFSTAAGDTGISDAEWWEAHYPYMADVESRFPLLAEAGNSGAWEPDATDQYFETGLTRILDGIAVRVAALAGQGAADEDLPGPGGCGP